MLLIPAYNEENRIEPVLRDYVQYFRQNYPGKFQIVVVLNGCVDNTLGVVRRVAQDFPEISSLEFHDRIGKGGALIEGLRLAPQGDLIGYVDADGATAPAAFLALVDRCGEADCVIGSRWLPGAVLHQSQSVKRRIASRIFHALVELLFRMNIVDTQCGAKVMHRAAVEQIHSSLRTADMAFDINLLYALKRAGFRILEGSAEDRRCGNQGRSAAHVTHRSAAHLIQQYEERRPAERLRRNVLSVSSPSPEKDRETPRPNQA